MRKIVINKKENKKNENESFISNSVNNESNMNIDNNINNELIIYKYNKNIDKENIIESAQTMKELTIKKDIKFNNEDNNNITETVNNKLKYLYVKLKNVQEKNKNKPLKCRICFVEGDFDGNNPLISPCNCTGSVKYIHLYCLRKWLTSKISIKSTLTNSIYCYTYKNLECEICKSIIPEQVEYRGKIISLLNFKDIEPPFLILQTMNQYNPINKNIEYNAIFVISFKSKKYLTIGRANNSDIKLNDISVSRNHSIINYDNGELYIDDIGSKFGTLLLIQNNILFLPYKEINIQTGKCHLIFYLLRTFLACLMCYKNKILDKLSYEKCFNSQDKNAYSQIIDNLINNIIDPIEKFSCINNSYNSDTENNGKEEIQNNIKINSNISNEDNLKINNDNMDKTPTLNIINDLPNKDNNYKTNNNTRSFIIKKLHNSLIDENNNNNINDSLKQNESNEMLFHEINKTNINYKNIKRIKRNGTSISIMNILNKSNKKAITNLRNNNFKIKSKK